jgi:hypothetical protein
VREKRAREREETSWRWSQSVAALSVPGWARLGDAGRSFLPRGETTTTTTDTSTLTRRQHDNSWWDRIIMAGNELVMIRLCILSH